MTTDDDFDRQIQEYLEPGPAELADRVIWAARAQLKTTRRRSAGFDWRAPWRNWNMTQNTRLLLVGGGALVVAIGVGLFGSIVARPNPGPGSSATPPAASQSVTPSAPSASAAPGPSVAVVSPRAPAWIATRSMITPRSGHMATLLLDGRVLVVGGPIESIGPRNSAELYDPASEMWAATGSMLEPRFEYTATVLTDGKVLVAGGNGNTGPLASAQLYDPTSGTWTATGAMRTPRYDHTATLLSDGKVLVAGGVGASTAPTSAELYDPVDGTWTATGAMATSRYDHTATLLSDGRVLVAAGFQDGFPDGPSAELYDPISGTWTAAANMTTPTPRAGHTATLLPDGKVLVAGGTIHGVDPLASVEVYDPQSGAWSATQGMVDARSSHTATLMPDGKVLVAGGRGSADASASGLHEPLASAELYDPASGTWSTTASMLAARLGHTATLLPDGRVLVASGIGMGTEGSVDLASAELYEPDGGS